MKKLFFFWLCTFICYYDCIAQITITNNGTTITNHDQNIYINGNILHREHAFIRNTGNIYVNGSIINNANTFFSDSSNGRFYLNGINQTISGTHILNFHRLILNTADSLELQQSIKVTDSLDFINGYIHLNGNTIDLDTTGKLVNERQTSHIYGIVGKIILRKYINQPDITNNIGGLGLKIKSNNNHGLVAIERSHSRQPAADTSIYRFYKITSQHINSMDSLIVAYFDDERFKNETNYKIFSKKVYGTSGWNNKGGTVNYITKEVSSDNIILDTLLITIADEACTFLPDIHIPGITNLVPLMNIDTITCANDTLVINAYSSAPNAIITWKDPLDSSIYKNPLQISAPNSFFINVENGVNGCANSILVNVAQFKTPPLLYSMQDSVFLNCSHTSLQLNDSTPNPQTTLVWTGLNNFNSSNPATVTQTGKYYVTATRADNGCTAIDSIFVGYKPNLILMMNNDTLVCKQSAIFLSAATVGSISGVSYVWSNGASSANTVIYPAVTTTYIVTANSPGCSGSDTVVVTIPSSITDTVATYQSCNGTTTGTLLVSAYGGIPPYLYSIDNGNTFSAMGNFMNTPYGTYTVLIKDSLGCIQSDTTSLNGFSSLPVTQFIASTLNTKGDTIVLVDISVPQPDSVAWILPAQASIIGGDLFNPIIFMPDTGAFTVTMIGFFADCVIDTTKLIHFFPADTNLASEYNNNGIKSLSLYPNPNNGIFTVEVEFFKKQNSSIQIWDTSPAKYFQQNFTDADRIILPINLPQLINGAHLLRVIGEYNSKHLNFIVSH